jgi:lysozyme
MKLHPRLDRACIDLVKRFEGLRLTAARLDGGGWTIGYGHTASAREGARVTPEEAEALLLYDLDRVARAIDPMIFSPVDDNQFSALVAFAFNVGVEAFRRSEVLIRVNEGAWLQAALAIELWRKAEFVGQPLVVDGLVRRRAAEKALFLTPPAGVRPTPTPVLRPRLDPAAPEIAAQRRGLARAADLEVDFAAAAAVVRRLDTPPLQDQAEPPPFPASPDPAPVAAPPAPGPRRETIEEPAAPRVPAIALGVIGFLLFGGALLTMVYGQATVANLIAGLVGVGFMIPAALRLLMRVFGERADAE